MTAVDPTKPTRRSRRRLWGALAGVLLALLVAGGAAALVVRDRLEVGDPVAGVTTVAVLDEEFAPEAVAVPVGSTVTWRWEGEEEHNVVGDGFESPVQTSGEFAHPFPEPGTYDYRCTLHFFMRGEVVVTEDAAASGG